MHDRSARGQRRPQLDYWTLAQLRYSIRKFLRSRETAARAAGVEPQQYLLLLQIKGLEGEHPATIGRLAERLQLRHHSTVELVNRLVHKGMVARRQERTDRREVTVELRPPGERVLRRLALHSLAELRTEGPALVAVLRRLIGGRQDTKSSPSAKAERHGRAPRRGRARLEQ